MKHTLKTTTVLLGLLTAPAMAQSPHPYEGYPYNNDAATRLYQFLISHPERRAAVTSSVYTYGTICKPIGPDLHDTLKLVTGNGKLTDVKLVGDKELQEANIQTDDKIRKRKHDPWCADWGEFVENYLYQGKRDLP